MIFQSTQRVSLGSQESRWRKGIRRRYSLHRGLYYSFLTFLKQLLGCLHGTPWTEVSFPSQTWFSAEQCELINMSLRWPWRITVYLRGLAGTFWAVKVQWNAILSGFFPLRWLLSWHFFGDVEYLCNKCWHYITLLLNHYRQGEQVS